MLTIPVEKEIISIVKSVIKREIIHERLIDGMINNTIVESKKNNKKEKRSFFLNLIFIILMAIKS